LLGKDLPENIILMLTFADADVPQVLSAAKADNLPFAEFHKFNNSATFMPIWDKSSSEYRFNQMLWNMGQDSMEGFFRVTLGRLPSKSLTLTRETLEKRRQLEVTLVNLQCQVELGVGILSELQQYIEGLELASNSFRDITELRQKYRTVQDKASNYLAEAESIVERLEEIALRPIAMSLEDYLELMIRSEEQRREPGWERRQEQYVKMRERQRLLLDPARALAGTSYTEYAFSTITSVPPDRVRDVLMEMFRYDA
jgi:hypothetical protein